MTRPPIADAAVATLVHTLEVRQAELIVQNLELAAANNDLRSANSAMTVGRDHYRTLYHHAPVALLRIDSDGSIIDVNDAAALICRTPRHLLIGRRLALFVPAELRASLAELIRGLFEH